MKLGHTRNKWGNCFIVTFNHQHLPHCCLLFRDTIYFPGKSEKKGQKLTASMIQAKVFWQFGVLHHVGLMWWHGALLLPKKLNSPHCVCVASTAQLYSLVYIIFCMTGKSFIVRFGGDREDLISIWFLWCFNGGYLSCLKQLVVS